MCQVPSAVQFYYVNMGAQSWADGADCECPAEVKRTQILTKPIMCRVWNKLIIYYDKRWEKEAENPQGRKPGASQNRHFGGLWMNNWQISGTKTARAGQYTNIWSIIVPYHCMHIIIHPRRSCVFTQLLLSVGLQSPDRPFGFTDKRRGFPKAYF